VSAGVPSPRIVAPFEKLLLIGCGGAGKSTLARRIAERTGLPPIHLDALYWAPGWQAMPRAQWHGLVKDLLRRPAWIMDGNYGDTLALRLAACDAVVFLDVAPWRCLLRVVARRLRFHGRRRPDMGPGCNERLEMAFVWYVLAYRRTRRPGILIRLDAACGQGKAVFVLRTGQDIASFLRGLQAQVSQASGT
jgi:adenylate kinase family enzyme